jgi:hypothetical protein
MSAFEDFIQVELPRRPWSATDPAQETVPVRRGAGPRQLEFVSLNDGQVLGKVGGVIQGVDVPGLGGEIIPKGYVHVQSTAADLWIVNHNLDSEDYVAFIFDDSGVQIFPDSVSTADADSVIIDFNTAITGKAVIIFAS